MLSAAPELLFGAEFLHSAPLEILFLSQFFFELLLCVLRGVLIPSDAAMPSDVAVRVASDKSECGS